MGQEQEKEQEKGQEKEMGQEKEKKLLTWQVDLAELNLQVSHPTASTSSPQLIFLISQSFLKRLQLLVLCIAQCARITCKSFHPPRTQARLF